MDLEILAVSQFTLYSVLKGTKPDFHNAMGGENAQKMFELFVDTVRVFKNYGEFCHFAFLLSDS